MTESVLTSLSAELGSLLLSKRLFFTSAESCTGGWVGRSITSVPGSSRWFSCSFVTYSNKSKSEILGVSHETLKKFGAVSEEVVKEMIEGGIKKSRADIGVAISGIAGPKGGSKERPVGTVYFAWLLKGHSILTSSEYFSGDREEVRLASVKTALSGSIRLLRGNK